MLVFANAFPSSICTSSTKASGTIIRRTAVHFCPHLTVISLRTSLINKSNSSVPGVALSPKIAAFKESASILKGTASSIKRGCAFSMRPVEAEPVNVTTSCEETWSKMPFADPQMSCNAPSGRILLSIMSLTINSVR